MKRAILLFLSICASGPLAAQTLTLYTENNEPFNFVEQGSGKIVGSATEIVQELMARAKISVTIDIIPWARALELTRQPSESRICMFSMTRTSEREPLYQWVGPIVFSTWTLFARHDFAATLSSLEDAKKYTIGGYLKDSRTGYLQALGGFKLDIVSNDILNPPKLAAGRIDLWLGNLYGGRAMAHSVGVDGVKPVLVFREVGNYLACAPKVPVETVAALRLALEQIRQDGTLARITARYMKPYGR